MNLKHLGDAFDHWKGSVLKLIPSQNLQIVPMFTDRRKWSQRHRIAYANLLQRKQEDIWRPTKQFSNETRGHYFDNMGDSDLFLDPDTGIASGKRAKDSHLRVSEISSLLKKSKRRVLFIYQHSSRKKDWLTRKLETLRSTTDLKGSSMFAYDSGPVSMIIISMSKTRVGEARRRLRHSLGPISRSRIVK